MAKVKVKDDDLFDVVGIQKSVDAAASNFSDTPFDDVTCLTHRQIFGKVSDFVKSSVSSKEFVADMVVPQYVQVQRNGILTSDRVMVTVDPREAFKGFSVNDFALQNLIAIGATNLLNPVAPLSAGLAGADDLLRRADEIGSIIDSQYADPVAETIVNSADAVASAVADSATNVNSAPVA